MATPQEAQCLAVLQAAATAQVGICLRTSNPMRARQALYNFRRAFGSPEFADIHIRASPTDPDGALWLLRRNEAAVVTLANTDLV